MYQRFYLQFLLCAIAALTIGATHQRCLADNGKLAQAINLDGIVVDGRLDDWPDSMQRYAIDHSYFGGKLGETDFHAEFRVGYNEVKQSLYFAIEIRDQSHQVDESGESVWNQQDSVHIYVDPTHSTRGSGPLLFSIIGDQKELMGKGRRWDPRVAAVTWDGSSTAVSRVDEVTIYEVQLELGDDIRGGRSIGLDFLISDHDEDESNQMVIWARTKGKSLAASRCGDLILLPTNTPLGKLQGTIGWSQSSATAIRKSQKVVDTEERLWCPRQVRIMSKTNPELWCVIETNERGEYNVELPADEYKVDCTFKTFNDNNGGVWKLDPGVSVDTKVVANQTTKAGPLQLVRMDRPDLIDAEGLLLNYDESTPNKVDTLVKAYMAYYQIPGVSLALIHENRIAYHQTYGLKNFYLDQPVTDDTLFEACSMTKPVFAFAVNRLAEQGKIDLDQPLYQYLPLEGIESDSRCKSITARHVLSHQTGLPNWRRNNPDGKLDIKFFPGTKYGYSGEGFEYLKRVVSKITGKTPEEFLLDEVQKPMGMTKNAYFSDSESLRASVANGHYTTRTTAVDIPKECGVAHSMHTEAQTFANFVVALNQKQGLSEDGYKRMFTPQVFADRLEPKYGPGLDRYFGLGFQLLDTPYGWSFGHGGSNGDFNCRFEAYPDQEIGFVIFTNSDTGICLCDELRNLLVLGNGGNAKDSNDNHD